jgi:hypothetical protein
MSIVRPRLSLWTTLRGDLQRTRDSYSARRKLERELALYTSESDLNDLYAILDRHSDEETADIRRILARRPA